MIRPNRLTWFVCGLDAPLLKTLYNLPWCTARRHLNRGPRNRHFHANASFERKSKSIVLFIVVIRSCSSGLQLYSLSSSPFAFFFYIPVCLVAISFWYYLWSNAAAKTKRKIGECLVASFYSLWKSKKDPAGQRKNTNCEFAEFLLYRGNSLSSPRDGNSNMKRREEMCLELDNG